MLGQAKFKMVPRFIGSFASLWHFNIDVKMLARAQEFTEKVLLRWLESINKK